MKNKLDGPPSVMRGYKPKVVRYCWVVKTTEGTYHTGLTWGGLPNLTDRRGLEIELLKIVDIVGDHIYEVIDYRSFLQDWSDNYFDPSWDVSTSKAVKE